MKLNKKRVLLIFLITGLAVYLLALFSAFQYDTVASILLNPEVKDIKGAFLSIFNINTSSSRRFVYFTFALNWLVGGKAPFIYKLTNLLIHIFSAYFLYLIILETEIKNRLINKNKEIYSILVGLLFLILPIQIQAVTYVVQRLASFVGLCYFAGLYFYIKYRKSENRKYLYYIVGLIFVLLGTRSKETMVTFPIALFLYEMFFFGGIKWQSIIYYMTGFIPLILRVRYSLMLHSDKVSTVTSTFALNPGKTDLTRYTYFITEFKVILRYLRLMIFPYGQRVDYNIKIENSFFSLWVILPFIILVLLLSFGIYYYKKEKIIGYGVLLFFIGFIVTSTIIPIDDLIYEHRAYISVAGYSIVISYFFILLLKERKKILYGMLLVGVVYGGVTVARNYTWLSMTSLWEDNHKKEPNLERPLINLCTSAIVEKKYKIAERYLKIAASKYPKHESILKDYIDLYKNTDRVDKAILLSEKSIEKNIGGDDVKLILAEMYYDKNRFRDSLKVLNLVKNKISLRKKILESKILLKFNDTDKAFDILIGMKSSDEVNSLLGYIYQQKGDIDKGTEYYKKSIKMEDSKINLALIYNSKGEGKKALKLLQEIKKKDSKNEKLYLALIDVDYKNRDKYIEKLKEIGKGLGEFYYKEGMRLKTEKKLEMAYNMFKQSIENNPYFMQSYYWIGEIGYSILKKDNEVLNIFLESEKENIINYYILGRIADIYYRKKEYDNSIEYYKKALKLKESDYFYLQLGKTYFLKKDIKNSVTNLEKAVELNNKNYIANYNLGVIYYSVKDYKKAYKYLNNANNIKKSDSIEKILKKIEKNERIIGN
ncbi:tetratricopeptide repeat protein [Haliovirga abyssi]|uniref:Tetratricopeptide repeat protein n=1 Tax=Haliovirga abyssi TaxID=2996794 RepID=A0AAU9DZV6_9FUSO|nr:tetratricopeptide repeat protein [Haliovirga abyssi]BDU51125.1 hypothetical protein HLVA_16940 [Haliovirga abyssi]